jgi:hypothetical protein
LFALHWCFWWHIALHWFCLGFIFKLIILRESCTEKTLLPKPILKMVLNASEEDGWLPRVRYDVTDHFRENFARSPIGTKAKTGSKTLPFATVIFG